MDRFTFGSSSGHSSSDDSSSGHSISDHSSLGHSSSGHSILGHCLSGHTPPDTTIADSSASPRFVYPPLARTPRDSSSESSAGPSHKRCRSPAAKSLGILFYQRDSVEETLYIDCLADIEADATAIEVAVDKDVEAGLTNLWACLEIPLQRVEDIETGQRELEARSLIAGRERASLLEHVASLERSNARDHDYHSLCQNGDDDDNRNFGGNGNRNGEGNGDGNDGGNRNRNGGGIGNGNPNRNNRGAMPIARECTYHDFVKCQPLNFKETKGVVGLTRWFEKMETVFHISKCPRVLPT
ncbi:hypothetical protein Tco_1538548 [Tanacetum coccineum]